MTVYSLLGNFRDLFGMLHIGFPMVSDAAFDFRFLPEFFEQFLIFIAIERQTHGFCAIAGQDYSIGQFERIEAFGAGGVERLIVKNTAAEIAQNFEVGGIA